MKLALDTFKDWQHDGVMMSLQIRAVTDAKGHFLFSNVPPDHIQVERNMPMPGGGYTSQMQTWLFVEPGITNDVGKVTLDQPPPLPALDRLKQSLGL